MIIFPILPAYSQEIFWDRSSYRINEVGVITLDNRDANKNPARIDLAHVWIYSDTDPDGFLLLVLETGSNTDLFKGDIEFGNVTSESVLHVTSGDVIYAEHESAEATSSIQGMVSDFIVKTGDATYQKGDIVKIEGSISNKKYNPNLTVVTEILDPLGKVIFDSQKYPTNQGTYTEFTTAGTPLWRSGNYTVIAQYGSIKAETNFSYIGENGVITDINSYDEHVAPWEVIADVVSSSQIELTWNPPTQTFGLDIVGYNINEKIGDGMYEEVATTKDTTNVILSGLEMGRTYTFVIQALYSIGTSEHSEEVSVSTPTIEMPNSDSESFIPNNIIIPDWIQDYAGWWAEGSIEDSDFVSGIQFLIKEEIITIPKTSQSDSESSHEIPPWIKNNAGWWSEGLISDNDFVKGIQYLMQKGIIIVTEPINQPPTVSIKSPDTGSSFEQGTLLSFSADATDPEDGTLTDSSSVFWSSTLDGTIGYGSSFSKSALSVGDHFITVRATDSEGLFDKDTIALTITERR